MPIDSRPRTTTTAKPITPTLSSNLRARPTFTPRLAGTGSGPVSPASASHRSLRQYTLSPERNEGTGTQSLNSNVTPRSGARNSRIEVEVPPTPDTTQHTLKSDLENATDSIGGTNEVESFSPTDTPSYSSRLNLQRASSGSATSQSKTVGKFFRADDVKSVSPNTTTSGLKPKTTDSSRTIPKLSPRKLASGSDNSSDRKFFHAAVLQNKAARPTLATKLFAASSTQSLPSLGNKTPQSTGTRNSNAGFSINTTTGSSHPPSISKPQSPSNINTPPTTTERRRSSSLNIRPVLSKSPTGHRKSLSTSTVSVSSPKVDTPRETYTTAARKVVNTRTGNTISQSPANVLSSTSTSRRSDSLSSVGSVGNPKNGGTTQIHEQTFVGSTTNTPRPRKASDCTTIQPVTQSQMEAAANARRERKVLDLEISNSSLLAINKTLEKELRKQNAELRRFRRLSRSGRLSLIPSDRNFSGLSAFSLATVDETEIDSAHAFSPGSSGDEYLDGDDDYDDTLSDEGSSLTESSDALRRRARDEKRLLLDLQRHQQILIDSQKLTQSIQRCLNFTDELIRDANKALTYQVEAEDVKLGGRVLSNDDEELSEVDLDEYSQSSSKPRQGLLSPAITMDTLEEASMWFKGLQSTAGLDTQEMFGDIREPRHTTFTESPSPTLSPMILLEKSVSPS